MNIIFPNEETGEISEGHSLYIETQDIAVETCGITFFKFLLERKIFGIEVEVR